jgi:hypothetical protein
VFDNAINNLIYESGTSTPNQGLLSWNTSNYAYTLNPVYNSQTNWNNCGDNKVTNIYEWLNWYFTQNGDNAKKLNIDNKRDDPYHLMIELLKFKLYVFANVTKRINSSSAWSDLFPNYDNCANTSPPLPLGTTSTLLLPRSGINNENWYTRDNWDSPYFYVNGHENTYILSCCRALLEWAIIKDDYGFIHTTGDYSRNDSYVEYLNVNTENFLYGYETLAASFSTEPITDFINIAVYWLLATIIVAAIVIVIYQRIDFK